jgi:hypothetical protein
MEKDANTTQVENGRTPSAVHSGTVDTEAVLRKAESEETRDENIENVENVHLVSSPYG